MQQRPENFEDPEATLVAPRFDADDARHAHPVVPLAEAPRNVRATRRGWKPVLSIFVLLAVAAAGGALVMKALLGPRAEQPQDVEQQAQEQPQAAPVQPAEAPTQPSKPQTAEPSRAETAAAKPATRNTTQDARNTTQDTQDARPPRARVAAEPAHEDVDEDVDEDRRGRSHGRRRGRGEDEDEKQTRKESKRTKGKGSRLVDVITPSP